MSKSLEQAIHERRLVLQSPYAYIEELEEINELKVAQRTLENPYAFASELDQLSRQIVRFDNLDVGCAPQSTQSAPPRKGDSEIQRSARELHTQIWVRRADIFPDYLTRDPIDMLDPIVALELLGYRVEVGAALGQIATSERRVSNVAGLIDRSSRQVLLSGGLPPAIRNFTAAHELGHAVLHEFSGMHRDKPMDGSSSSRDHIEREADKFAALFLMPEKLVRRAFEEIFGTPPFILYEDSRFALSGSIPHAQWQPRNLRDLSRLLSVATRFNGVSFVSLADRFRVSVGAMAIRLEQLTLISQDNA